MTMSYLRLLRCFPASLGLMLTKYCMNISIVWQLIRHGSSVSARNMLGFTPVHIAAAHGHIQALQVCSLFNLN
jgi:ankyrin repeat protein